jgi:ABC-type amino acid transport substrate-binding protein
MPRPEGRFAPQTVRPNPARQAGRAQTVFAWLATAVGLLATPVWASQEAVRFAPERDYGPFVFEGTGGRIEGLSIDMLRLVQQHASLEVKMLPARPLAEQLEAAKRGEVDLLSSLRPTPERGEFLRFSVPYVKVPAVLVCAGDACAATPKRASGLAGLAGQPVAVGAGYAVEPVMRAQHQTVTWQAVSDDVVALKGVVAGRYKGAVVDAASFEFVVRQHRLRGLQAVERVGFDYSLSFAAPIGREDLIALLDKAIVALPTREREAVIDRWMASSQGTAPAHAGASTWLAATLLALAAAIAAILGWRRSRQPVP